MAWLDAEEGGEALAEVVYDRFAQVLPGSPTSWHSECPSSTDPYVYFGELDLRAGMVDASIEDVGSFEFEPFDERAYLGAFFRGSSSPVGPTHASRRRQASAWIHSRTDIRRGSRR